MKKNIQRQLIMFSKRLLYGFIIQLFFCTVLIANDSNAQRKTIENVKVNIAIKEKPVSVAFELIESTTDFRFTYNDNLIDFNQTITIVEKNKSVYKVLEEISKQTQMNFVQVNENIHVNPKKGRKDGGGILIIEGYEKIVTGTVKDNNGEPLPGVSIIIEGTSIGTISDLEGNYSLEVPQEGILLFSFIGFEKQRVELSGQSIINIILLEDASSLQEVVVMGYGVQNKKDLTGSVSTVNNERIDNRKAIQLSDALQGAMAGVTVSRTGSAPGQASTIRVRGITSLNVNDPLVIVDGVPGLSLEDINPNDVENITVLKDAASQAIYGARAAAGVILVTTKRGKEGKIQINLDSDFGFNSPTTLPKFTDAKTFRILSNERSLNDGGGIIFDTAVNENYEQLNRDDPDRYPNTDWQDLIFNNIPSTRQRHDLSLSMGTERLFTRASFGYMKEDGIHDNIGFDRLTFRINNDFKFSKIFRTNADIGYRGSNSTNPAYERGAVADARRFPAWFSGIRQDGEWGEGKDGDNPFAEVVEGGNIQNRRDVFNASLGFTISPIEGFNIKGNISPVYEYGNFEIFRTPPIIPRLDGGFFPQNQLNLTLGNQKVFSLTNQLFASYQKSVNDHNFDVLVGYESFKTSWEQVEAEARDLSVKLPALAFGDRSLATNQQFASENALESYFGRFSYDYKQKYFFQSNFRVDGSSRFAPDVRWGFFPSASVGWVISNENFNMPGFISFLKLRASYGEVGNERVGNARTGGSEFFNFYPYQGIFQPITNILFYNNNQISPALGLVQNFLSDNLIQWETTKTINAGLDFGFFGDRLTLSTDYYVRTTENIIDLLDIPNYLGFPQNTRTNVASIEARGLDFEVGFRGNSGKLNYSINGNAAFVNTEVINLGSEFFLTGGGNLVNQPGFAYNEWFGFKTDGLFQTQEEADLYGTGAKAGDVKILDLNGDAIINEEDRVPLGPSLPRLNYGGSISLNYNNFDFNLVAYGVGEHTRRYEGFQVRPFDEAFGNIPLNIVGNFWSSENSVDENLAATYPRLSQTSFRNYENSDFWLYNGGFLRIQNITLGYSLPLQLIERLKMNRLRAYVSLRDFFTIESNFLQGWDPEAGNTSYPIMKSVIMGLQVQF